MSKAQEAALKEVERLQKELKDMSSRFWHNGSSSVYTYTMEELEKTLERHIKKVAELTKEYGLDNTIALKFKKEGLETIYATSIARGEYAWAAAFAKKHGL